MAEPTQYLRIPELIDQLKGKSNQLENGSLGLEELAKMTESARELYERLVILTYKTGEAELAKPEQAPVSLEPEAPAQAEATIEEEPESIQPLAVAEEPEPVMEETTVQPEPVIEAPAPPAEAQQDVVIEETEVPPAPVESAPVEEVPPPVISEEPPAVEAQPAEPAATEEEQQQLTVEESNIKFDFGSPEPEVPANQTSLIDAIREEEEKSLNDSLGTKKEDSSVASSLAKSPIANLKDAIAINMKFIFMNDLFEGENTSYNQALETINNFQTIGEANDYIREKLIPRYQWDMESSSASNFMALVERRFL